MTKPKTGNSGRRKVRTANKMGKLGGGDRLYIKAHLLTNAEYHDLILAVSSTALKEIHLGKNPSWCFKKYIKKEVKHKQSPAMLLGAATHKIILEPSTFKREFAIWDGRRAGNSWNDFKSKNHNKDILTRDEYKQICAMRDAVMLNPFAKNLLSGGEAETSVFWRDEETGVLCRARADYLKVSNNKRIIVDVKTCKSAEPKQFAKDLVNMGYPIQQGMYIDGFQADAFGFIAIEKETNTVQVYVLNSEFCEGANVEYKKALEKWAHCLQENKWPSYAEGITELEPPYWWLEKVYADE